MTKNVFGLLIYQSTLFRLKTSVLCPGNMFNSVSDLLLLLAKHTPWKRFNKNVIQVKHDRLPLEPSIHIYQHINELFLAQSYNYSCDFQMLLLQLA